MEVLVVEDNDVLRGAIREQLKRIGLTVHEARDGQEAIEHAELRCCRVILMDVMMPKKNGLEAIKEIRQRSMSAEKIVVMTAGETTRAEALEAGADDFIKKPIMREQLEYVVSHYGHEPQD